MKMKKGKKGMGGRSGKKSSLDHSHCNYSKGRRQGGPFGK
jgi:hypothetical protein